MNKPLSAEQFGKVVAPILKKSWKRFKNSKHKGELRKMIDAVIWAENEIGKLHNDTDRYRKHL